MRSKMEIEIETAANIMRTMGNTLDKLARYWPQSKRGSNAQRQLDDIRSQRASALQCLIDAAKEDHPQ